MTKWRPTFCSAVDVIGGRTGGIIRKIHFFILCRTYILFCHCICTATNCSICANYLLEEWHVGQFLIFFPISFTGCCIKVVGKHSCFIGMSGLHWVATEAVL